MSRISALVAAAVDTETIPVELPKWGVTINVRSLDGNQRSDFQAALANADSDDEGNSDVKSIEKALLALSCFDPEDGTQAFTEADVDMLWTKNGAYIGKLVQTAMKVSGLSKEVEDETGKVSSASEPTPTSSDASQTPSDGSTSTSPES